MAEYVDKLRQDLGARLEEVKAALAQYDALVAERERLEAALEALSERPAGKRD
jgi:hypothetical protein